MRLAYSLFETCKKSMYQISTQLCKSKLPKDFKDVFANFFLYSTFTLEVDQL